MPRHRSIAIVLSALALTALSGPDLVAGGLSGARLAPLPKSGEVPSILLDWRGPTADELALRARRRGYEKQIRQIRRKHFGSIRRQPVRDEGIALVQEFKDPAAFRPLIEVLGEERDDVRLALLDHFRGLAGEGQTALAWVAVTHEEEAIREEAMARMTSPAGPGVLAVLDQALRSPKHAVANHAGALAGALGAIETIPLLIFAQATRDPAPQDEGDLAWIAIGTQQAFVANLIPVVGSNSGAFQPVLGVINEGIVLRVTDAVVIIYRTIIHNALVSLSTRDFGESTEAFGYDTEQWWRWYNDEYLPLKLAQRDAENPAGG